MCTIHGYTCKLYFRGLFVLSVILFLKNRLNFKRVNPWGIHPTLVRSRMWPLVRLIPPYFENKDRSYLVVQFNQRHHPITARTHASYENRLLTSLTFVHICRLRNWIDNSSANNAFYWSNEGICVTVHLQNCACWNSVWVKGSKMNWKSTWTCVGFSFTWNISRCLYLIYSNRWLWLWKISNQCVP